MTVNEVVEFCFTKDYIANQKDNDKFSRYDLIVKYLFIEKYYEMKKPKDLYFTPYELIIKTRERDAQPRKFIALIKSFEKKGYDKKYPLYMTRDYITGGGKHRIALCLWFNIKEFPVIYREHYRKKKRKYTREKMIEYGFKKYMPDIKETKKKIFKKLNII